MAWLAWTLTAFISAVIAQSLILRLTRLRNGVVGFAMPGVFIGLMLMVLLLSHQSPDRALSGTLLYAFLCELWIFVFTLVFSSISASLMLHLRKARMRQSEINQLYDSRNMIQSRVDGLCNIGAVASQDGKLVPTNRGKQVAHLFDALRAFFGHR